MYNLMSVLIFVAFIFSMFAQFQVSGTFKKYSKVMGKKGYSGADVARQLLMMSGVHDVSVELVRGHLTDHYDPRTKTVRLSESVYNSTSLAALGVAAHETGHALQHDTAYMPLTMRSSIFPVVNFGQNIAPMIIIAGFLLSAFGGAFGLTLIYVGIVLFATVVAFQLITLPVEFNASARALRMLEDNNFVGSDEIGPARKVLTAAALTYLAAAILAVLQLARFIMLANSRRD